MRIARIERGNLQILGLAETQEEAIAFWVAAFEDGDEFVDIMDAALYERLYGPLPLQNAAVVVRIRIGGARRASD
jgi:predicted TPR repeat methyltransferase